MLVRAFRKNAHVINPSTGVSYNETTDNLEANTIVMEMFEAYFAPLVGSIFLSNNPAYKITSSNGCVIIFFWL